MTRRKHPLPSRRQGAIAAAFVGIAAMALLLGVPFLMEQRRVAIVTDGLIVDKRVSIRQWRGSGVQYLLVIRSANGEQLSVAVPVQIYEKAAVGMHAVKRPGHEWPDLEP